MSLHQPETLSYPVTTVKSGQVKSKSNFRRSGKSKWSEIASFEYELAHLIRQARPSDWQTDEQKKVSDRPKVVAVIIARTMLDAGNLSKSVLDAAEGVLFQNDASVSLVMEYADRGRDDQQAIISFIQLPHDADKRTAGEAAIWAYQMACEQFDL